MMTATHAIAHVRVETAKAFAAVTKDFETQLGTYHRAAFQAFRSAPPQPEEARARIEAMAGQSGFLLFGSPGEG